MKQFTKEEAIEFYNGGEWKSWTHEQIVRMQLFNQFLAVPFGRFHEAIEAVLGRPVYTHEFANQENIIKEYLGAKDAPTLEEIIDLIPAEKRILIKR